MWKTLILPAKPIIKFQIKLNLKIMSTKSEHKSAEYDGHCAFAVSTGKMDVEGGKHNSMIDGNTYYFSNPVAKILFKLLPNRISKADENWKNRN